MNLTAMLQVYWEGELGDVALMLGQVFGVHFVFDSSGRYEEHPAYVADVFGSELAVLGSSPLSGDEKMDGFQLMMSTYEEVPGDCLEVDLSVHLAYLLSKAKVRCSLV